MQLFARTLSGTRISLDSAEKQHDYFCEECGGVLHIRSGSHRQPHFYHLSPPSSCHQHAKSPTHIQTQLYLHRQLPQGELFLEHRFPTIGRIADAAWIPYKCVFEIQCSPISREEVLSRNADYAKEGWLVIWLLHDRRFNRSAKPSRLDPVFETLPHYFTNINAEGKGCLYDQFSIWKKGYRTHKLNPLPLVLSPPQPFPSFPIPALNLLKNRQSSWPIFLPGDLLSLFYQTPSSPYIQSAFLYEKNASRSILLRALLWIKQIYLKLLHHLLDQFALTSKYS